MMPNEFTNEEKKLLLLIRNAKQHERFEVVKSNDGIVVKRTQKVQLDDIYKDI